MDPEQVTAEELKETINSLLKKCIISSPVYGILKRRLAELLFEANESLQGIVHLVESLGGKHKFENLKLEQEYELTGGSKNEDNLKNLDHVKVFNSVPLTYASSQNFLDDLDSLPPEWTLVQLTRKPQCGDVLLGVRQHVAGHHEFALDEARLVVLNSGRQPLQVLVDKPQGTGEHMKTYLELMNEALNKLNSNTSGRNARTEGSALVKDVSRGLGDSWLREYQCLLPGNVKCPRLNASIQATLNSIRASLVTMTTASETFLRRLLNGVHLINEDQVYALVLSYVTKEDDLVADMITKAVMRFKETHGNELSSTNRYPVILLLEEELFRLPWECALCLRTSPVTRVHCFQFVLALVKLHTSSLESHSVGLHRGYLRIPELKPSSDAFVVLNPSCDLPAVQTKFQSFLNKKFGKWKGVMGKAPTSTEFAEGLSHSLFIYCGHGNGTVYLHSDKIARSRVRSVTLLFGCRSVELGYHGGRVPFSSLTQKYFVAGSPSVVGFLWNISSSDCDRIASNLLNISLPSPPPSPSPLDLPSIVSDWWSVPFNPPVPYSTAEVSKSSTAISNGSTAKKGSKAISNSCELSNVVPLDYSPDLCANVQVSRQGANYFINAAALIVWGLPVWFGSSPI